MIQGEGQCGLYALRYTLAACLRQKYTRTQLQIMTGYTYEQICAEGLSEKDLVSVIRECGLAHNAIEARRNRFKSWLNQRLLDHAPVIYNVYNGYHWVCITQLIMHDRYVVIDSFQKLGQAVQLLSLKEVLALSQCSWYYGLALISHTDNYWPEYAALLAQADECNFKAKKLV